MKLHIAKIFSEYALEAVLLWNPAEIVAVTGFLPDSEHPVALILRPEQTCYILPQGSPMPPKGSICQYYPLVSYPARVNPSIEMLKLLKQQLAGLSRIGVSYSLACALPYYLPEQPLVDITRLLNSIGLVKPSDFIEKFTRASRLNQSAYESVRSGLQAGMTEFELRELVEHSNSLHSGLVLPSGGDYLSGKRTSEISGPPTNKTIQPGEAIVVDLQLTANSAGVDDCRTFFMGTPSAQQAAAYKAVETALETGARFLKPGVKASEVYNTVSMALVNQNYPALPHHAGHGVGYAWNEAPFFIPQDHTVLQPGMLVTLEPGIYLKDFGIRIENNYLITQNSAECITQTPWSLNWATLHPSGC